MQSHPEASHVQLANTRRQPYISCAGVTAWEMTRLDGYGPSWELSIVQPNKKLKKLHNSLIIRSESLLEVHMVTLHIGIIGNCVLKDHLRGRGQLQITQMLLHRFFSAADCIFFPEV